MTGDTGGTVDPSEVSDLSWLVREQITARSDAERGAIYRGVAALLEDWAWELDLAQSGRTVPPDA